MIDPRAASIVYRQGKGGAVLFESGMYSAHHWEFTGYPRGRSCQTEAPSGLEGGLPDLRVSVGGVFGF